MREQVPDRGSSMEVSPPSHRHASDAKVYRPNRYRRCKMEQQGFYLDVIICRHFARRQKTRAEVRGAAAGCCKSGDATAGRSAMVAAGRFARSDRHGDTPQRILLSGDRI